MAISWNPLLLLRNIVTNINYTWRKARNNTSWITDPYNSPLNYIIAELEMYFWYSG